MEISKFVGYKLPISILLGLPEPLVPRLNCRDHQIADAREISGGLRRGRRFWSCGHAGRGRETDHHDGCSARATAATRIGGAGGPPILRRSSARWQRGK